MEPLTLDTLRRQGPCTAKEAMLGPTPRSNWVLPGLICIGDSPRGEGLQQLLDCGLRRFVDVRPKGEMSNFLEDSSRSTNIEIPEGVTYEHVDFGTFVQSSTRAGIQEAAGLVHDIVAKAIETEEEVYISCSDGNTVAPVVACAVISDVYQTTGMKSTAIVSQLHGCREQNDGVTQLFPHAATKAFVKDLAATLQSGAFPSGSSSCSPGSAAATPVATPVKVSPSAHQTTLPSQQQHQPAETDRRLFTSMGASSSTATTPVGKGGLRQQHPADNNNLAGSTTGTPRFVDPVQGGGGVSPQPRPSSRGMPPRAAGQNPRASLSSSALDVGVDNHQQQVPPSQRSPGKGVVSPLSTQALGAPRGSVSPPPSAQQQHSHTADDVFAADHSHAKSMPTGQRPPTLRELHEQQHAQSSASISGGGTGQSSTSVTPSKRPTSGRFASTRGFGGGETSLNILGGCDTTDSPPQRRGRAVVSGRSPETITPQESPSRHNNQHPGSNSTSPSASVRLGGSTTDLLDISTRSNKESSLLLGGSTTSAFGLSTATVPIAVPAPLDPRKDENIIKGPTPTCHWVVKDSVCHGAKPEARHKNFAALCGAKFDCFVCVLEEDDTDAYFEHYAEMTGIRPSKLFFPMKDGEPLHANQVPKFLDLVTSIVSAVRAGSRIYVYCKGGHGRSGMVVAAMLAMLYGLTGMKAVNLCDALHNCRQVTDGQTSPQTQEQRLAVITLMAKMPK